MEHKQPEGFLLIDKPTGITSFDCIRHIRKITGRSIKIGHAGTLDPFAEGLLIIALSRTATREIGRLTHCSKSYSARAQLGTLTDTLDATGTVLSTCAHDTINHNDLTSACLQLQPEYTQIPPIYSALKHKGIPLYALAHKKRISSQELEVIAQQKQRTVEIHAIEITQYASPFFMVHATVSGGTYIRSLINDIALRVNSCATTLELQRTAIGPFNLSHAYPLRNITSYEDIEKALIPTQKFIEQLSRHLSILE